MIKSAISFLLGCLLLTQLPILPDSRWLLLALALLILVIRSKKYWPAMIIFGFAWSYFQANLILTDRIAPTLQGQDIVMTGTISSIPEAYVRRIRFEFKPDQNLNNSLPKKLLLNWYQPLPQQLLADETWQLTVRLKQPYGMKNPYTFDYESWLFQQGIGATGYVRNNENNIRIEPASPYVINTIRQTLFNKINMLLSDSPNKGIVQGLTTGIRQNISPQQWDLLRLSGTSHLLAISGLHIGLAAAIGFFSFQWVWGRRPRNLLILPAKQAGAIGGFCAALFYAALAGFSIPTQRALLMVSIVMISLIIKRPNSITSTLALSLVLILIWDPFAVLSAGFWLSYTAVAIILFTSQYRVPRPKWQWAKIHIFIALGLTPFLLHFFLQVSLIAPLANFLAVPFVSLVIVPLLLAASLLLWLFEPIGEMLFEFADVLLSYFWPLLDYVVSFPFSHWSTIRLPLLYGVPISVGIILLLAPRGFPNKHLGVIGLLPLVLYSPPRPDKGEFWFTLLDVGQGLAAIIQTQQHTLVFDAGAKFSDKFNTGTAVVLPYLQSQGINSVDSLIISHSDNDHIGGALPLIDNIPIKNILSSSPEKLINARYCQAGQSWQWDEVTFSMLHPQQHDIGSDNNQSCVLHIENNAGSVLLTGDIEKKQKHY